MPVKPIRDNVLVKFPPKAEKIGLVDIPPSTEDKPITALVEAVAGGRYEKGKYIGSAFRPGDEVILAKFQGYSFERDDGRYACVPEASVLAVYRRRT